MDLTDPNLLLQGPCFSLTASNVCSVTEGDNPHSPRLETAWREAAGTLAGSWIVSTR